MIQEIENTPRGMKETPREFQDPTVKTKETKTPGEFLDLTAETNPMKEMIKTEDLKAEETHPRRKRTLEPHLDRGLEAEEMVNIPEAPSTAKVLESPDQSLTDLLTPLKRRLVEITLKK